MSPPPPRSRLGWWAALVAAVVALVVFLVGRFPDSVSSDRDWAGVTYLVALLALVSSGVVIGRRTGFKRSAMHVLAWAAIALVLVAGYAYRAEFAAFGERVLGELVPHRGTVLGDAAISFRVGVDGHFRIEALVDGTPVRFLVDTGASDVMLSPADARRLGFDLDALSYTRIYSTANGTVRGAPVRLGEVVVGPIRMRRVPASVNEAPMASSLLGMSFLDRLAGYEVRADTLTLHR